MTLLERTIKILQEATATAVRANAATSADTATARSRFRMAFTLKTCTQPRLLTPLQDTLLTALRAANLRAASRALPTRIDKWTVLASPFVHKTARSQLERRKAGRSVVVEGVETEECRERLLWWVKRIVPADVELEIEVTERL